MKYIRTKDGIYELEHDGWLTKRTKPKHVKMLVAIDEEHYEMRKIIHKKEIGKKYWETEIIKQADTIEKLCDEWVLPPQLNKKSYDILDAKLFDFNSLKSCWAKEQKIIYGAIWTDKGLIYVAKMNDKGELELLWKSYI